MYSRLIGTSILLACSVLSVSAGTAQLVELDGGHVYKIKGKHGDCVNIRNMIVVYVARISEDPIGFTLHSGPNCAPDTRVHCIDRTSTSNIFTNPQNGQSLGFFDDGSTTNSAAMTCALSGNNPFGGPARDDAGNIISDAENSNKGSDSEDRSGGDSGGSGSNGGKSGSFGSSGAIGGGNDGGDRYSRRKHGNRGHKSGGFGSSGRIVG